MAKIAKKILIIEDEPYIAEMYRLKLEMIGYDIQVAGDGKEGLDIAKSWLPDFILLDLILPEMSGYEVLKTLKSDNTTKNIRVQAFTNLGQEREQDKIMAAGAEGCWLKTDFTPSSLAEELTKILS